MPDFDDEDPANGLSLAEFALRLGCKECEVLSAEQDGRLFSVRRRHSEGVREYPAFQCWQRITGAPLESLLRALGHPTGPEAYAFFTSPQDALGGLSPIEALQGFTNTPLTSTQAHEFLASPPEQRLSIVQSAARTYADSLLM